MDENGVLDGFERQRNNASMQQVALSVRRLLSWNSMGPTSTPTRTLGMRRSCNFVNVYTIAYRVAYSTCAFLTNNLARKRACRISRRGSSCVSASGKLNVPREDPCRCLCLSRGIPALTILVYCVGPTRSGVSSPAVPVGHFDNDLAYTKPSRHLPPVIYNIRYATLRL